MHTTYLLITHNTQPIRTQLHAHSHDIQLVAAQHDFMVWLWRDAAEEEIAPLKEHSGVLSLVELGTKPAPSYGG